MARPTVEQVKAFRAACRLLVPADFRIVFQIFESSYDGYSRQTERIVKVGPKRVVKFATEEYANSGGGTPTTVEEVTEYARVNQGGEDDYMCVNYYTLKSWKETQEEKIRLECEKTVSNICKKYNVRPNSLEMVKALHEHFEEITGAERDFRDNPERRAERWMDASYNGNTSGFWEDNDYSSSLICEATDKLEEAIAYLHKYCPLLMARYGELKKKK